MKFLIKLMGIFLLFMILAGCSSVSEPPDAIVKIKDKNLEVSKGTYQWETKGFFSTQAVIADAAAPFQIAAGMKPEPVKPGEVAKIEFSDKSKPNVQIFLWESEMRGKELPLNKNQLTLPTEKGIYTFEVSASWTNGDCSYTFVVEIK